jgi:LemA protein
MKAGLVVVAVLVAVGVIFGGFYISQKNGLIAAEEQVNTAWSQVENQYQRRSDLVPNLVETVKGVAGFEQQTYTAVAEARAQAGQLKLTPEMLEDPAKLEQYEKAQAALGSGLSRLLATAEAYPQLKANENFKDLQVQLEGTENRISTERRRYNETVQAFNLRVKQFPGSMVAGMMGMAPKAYFQAAEGAKEAPKVNF